MLLTIIIRTYNRENYILRALKSLERQSVQEFECLIIDDGSTDNTAKVVEEFKQRVAFRVNYYYQKNKGSYRALNVGILKTKTPFFLLLDSDDYLSKDAVEVLLSTWNRLSKKEKKAFNGGIVGLVKNAKTGKIVDGIFPSNINNMSKKKYLSHLKTGRMGMVSTELCKRHLVMEEKECSFMMESTIWIGTDIESRSYVINKVLYYYDMDVKNSITHSRLNKKNMQNMFCSYQYIINRFYPTNVIPIKEQIIAYTFYIRFGFYIGEKYVQIIRKLSKKWNQLLCFILTPLALIFYLKDLNKRKGIDKNDKS